MPGSPEEDSDASEFQEEACGRNLFVGIERLLQNEMRLAWSETFFSSSGRTRLDVLREEAENSKLPDNVFKSTTDYMPNPHLQVLEDPNGDENFGLVGVPINPKVVESLLAKTDICKRAEDGAFRIDAKNLYRAWQWIDFLCEQVDEVKRDLGIPKSVNVESILSHLQILVPPISKAGESDDGDRPSKSQHTFDVSFDKKEHKLGIMAFVLPCEFEGGNLLIGPQHIQRPWIVESNKKTEKYELEDLSDGGMC